MQRYSPTAHALHVLFVVVSILIVESSDFLAAPSAAPAGAPSSAESGYLVHKVRDQLAGDHRQLGNVSATLLAVQSEVSSTEESMLGRVLDLQTARNFFTRHEEIDTANEKLRADIAKLNEEVEGLSSALSKEQKEFLANALAYRIAEGKLHAQIIEDEAVIASINKELAKEKEIREALKKLTEIHENLIEEGKDARKKGEAAAAMLVKERALSRGEVARHRILRAQLVRMHNYSLACHDSVEKASKKLGMVMITEAKDNQAAKMTAQQKQASIEATEQRLLAERAILIAETKRAETDTTEALKKLKDLREDENILNRNIINEEAALQAKIKAAKDEVKTLGAALMENSQAEMEDAHKKEAIEAELKELMKQVRDEQDPIIIATVEAQNDALQAELNEAYKLWKVAKTSETAALLNKDQSAAEAEAAQRALKTAHEAEAEARAEGRKKLEEAVKKAAKENKNSQDLIDKAQAALAARCKVPWDSLAKKKSKKLDQCAIWENELEMENAKKETLVQTIKAQSEAMSAGA